MQSRYDFMSEGSVIDEETGSSWPDPLSLDYLSFAMKDTPKKDIMSDNKIVFFWKEASNIYGKPEWDDIVLTLNGIPHRNFLQVGDAIYFPSESEIKNSFKKDR